MSENHGYVCVGECQHFIDKKNEVLSLQHELEEEKQLVKGLEGNLKACEEELELTEKKLVEVEARAERLKELINRIACSHHPKHVNCEVAWQEIAGTCAAVRDESPSDALRAYEQERFRERTEGAVEALELLSMLGNEPFFGNSKGNVEAQKALKALKQERGE